MWLRYKRAYGSGPWTTWHLPGDSPQITLCGLCEVPLHRLEQSEQPADAARCKSCTKLTSRRTR